LCQPVMSAASFAASRLVKVAFVALRVIANGVTAQVRQTM